MYSYRIVVCYWKLFEEVWMFLEKESSIPESPHMSFSDNELSIFSVKGR